MKNVDITPTKRGFKITRKPCVVCGEPPFGDEYCCGHTQEQYKDKDGIWHGLDLGPLPS